MSQALLDLPLHQGEFYASQPWDTFRRMREEAPVMWCEGGRFWAVAKHADVVEISRNPGLFSSENGVSLDERVHPERIDSRELPDGELILTVDPPRHSDLRRILAHHFSGRGIAHLEEGIREIVRRNLEETAERGVANYADLVSIRTAIQTICLGLDLPPADWQTLKQLSATQTAGFDAVDEADFKIADDGYKAIRDYFVEALEDRRRNPRGEHDWMTTLVQARIDGEPLSLDTQLMFCIDLLVAGNETTDPLLAGGALSLWEHQDERRRLIEDPDLMPNAVNELLRWVTPVWAMARTATADTEIRGVPIKEGDFVALMYGAANRDEEVWENSERLDVGRPKTARQLSFGTGIHVCIGAHLARMEARILFSEQLERYPDYEVAGEVVRIPSTIVNAIRDLPLALRP
jgi:cytochrome P450